MRAKLFHHVRLFVILWTVALQPPLSVEFSRQEYWSGIPFSRDLPNPGMEPTSLYISCIGRRIPYKQCHLTSIEMMG